MTTFVFTQTVPTELISAALGVDANNKLTINDLGKPVKLAASNNYVVCSATDQIDGFVGAIEPFTVNDGFSFGGVQLEGRVQAIVGANQVSTLNVGDLVVADTQVANNTAGLPAVKQGTGVAGKESWKVIRIVTGTGVVGDTVLLERP